MVQPIEQLDDADLASKAKRGDRAAFAAIYARHYGLTFGYFRARVLDNHMAEDMTQEVFLRVFDAISRFNTELRLQSWLMGICRNVLREHVRKQMRRREIGWTELCLELEDMFNPGDDEGMFDDILHLVPVCMSKLSEPSANSIRWHYMGGMKVQKIADKLDRTLGAVKVLMVRARQALKRCIKTHLEGGSSK